MAFKGQRGGGYDAIPTNKKVKAVTASPFFRPSDPKAIRPMSTPGGTVRMQRKEVDAENKSTIFGASANLLVSIVGAGIVGVPFAIKESGLVAGAFLVIFVALITEKSLRLLIDTAKHVDVPSYETLYEAAFGFHGFVGMSLFMFTMAYGAITSYMMILKETLCFILGVPEDNFPLRRAVLTITTLLVLFPLSAQRDMADLAKTSKVSVFFYIFIVAFVALNSPVKESIKDNGGWQETVETSLIKPETIFTGLGVLSFAFVCQHSAFIIAGSLERPTRKRWAKVTGLSLASAGILATLIGTLGFLGFLDDTDGNILGNFDDVGSPLVKKFANFSRFILCCCMFCVYPMDAFVSRHVCVVLFFKGRQAHEGDDHSVLARSDRRIMVSFVLYLITLIPALLLEDLGSVLAVTGAIAGSFLSYIGPGTAYLGIHGGEFLKLCNLEKSNQTAKSTGKSDVEANNADDENTQESTVNPIKTVVVTFFWYVTLMPVWVIIAQVGKANLEKHYETEALKSPHPNRLGKVNHKNPNPHKVRASNVRSPSSAVEKRGLVRTLSMPKQGAADDSAVAYGSIQESGGLTRGVITTKLLQEPTEKKTAEEDVDVDDDPQEAFPKIYDFAVAIGYIVFGIIAMVAGLFSILNSADAPAG